MDFKVLSISSNSLLSLSNSNRILKKKFFNSNDSPTIVKSDVRLSLFNVRFDRNLDALKDKNKLLIKLSISKLRFGKIVKSFN